MNDHVKGRAERAPVENRRGWERDIISGTVVTLVTLAYSLSFALLIFDGPLLPGLQFGVSAALLSAGICSIVSGAGSSFTRAVAGPDSAPMAIMSVLAGTVAAHTLVPGATLPTVLATLAVAAFVTGAFLLLLGAFRLETAMRYIPYPVVAGFITAVGLQLALGGAHVLAGQSLTLRNLEILADPTTDWHLLAGVAFASAAVAAQILTRSHLSLPALLVGATVLAHAVFGLGGLSLEQARAAHWLLQIPATTGVFLPLAHGDSIEWAAILSGAGEIGAAAAIVAMSVLLNGTSLELWSRRGLDLNRELIVNGVANVLAGLAGALPGNLSFNRSVLNARTGATGRSAGIVSGVLLLALVVVGPGIMGFVPTPVLGGLLIYLGMNVLWDTFSRARHTLGWPDYVFLAILVTLIINWGYFEGVALGVVASCVLFVVRYSRLPIVRHDLTRKSFSSNVERRHEDSAVLLAAGGEMHVLWLRGYLFFGTANRFYTTIESRLRGAPVPLKYLVIDFGRVSGIDSSAVFSFVKLADLAREHDMTIAFCALSHDSLAAFRNEGLLRSSDRHVRGFPTLDQGLEWSEERMLDAHRHGAPHTNVTVSSWLAKELGSESLSDRLLAGAERLTLDKGDTLFRQGDAADALYFIEEGRLAIVMSTEEGAQVRLRTMATHTVLGEMGLYRDLQRTATVTALEPSRVLKLTRDKFMALKAVDPELCDAIHRMVVRTLSDRLAFANSAVAALQ